MELCKYCKEKEAIKNSHIIPSFVYEWIKVTSPTGYMRTTDEPNLRKQDGLKSALLCLDCERDFSKLEDVFKKEYFSKVANYRKPCPDVLDISVDTIKCIYIMAWRALADALYFPKENEYTDGEISRFPVLLDEMKNAIETGSFTKFRAHAIPCTKEVLTTLNLPKVPWHMYERSVTAEPRIWDNWERFVLYIQIPFSIIVFEIVPNTDDPWVGTQLENVDKIVLNDIESVPDYVGALVNHFYKAFVDSNDEISDVQRKKMAEDVEKADPNCGSFKTMKKSW
ncbi:hypothetical protein HYO33_23550 [Vibrio parahaemolyticus]|uniref:hypothetical protein n=1 Tax=Vibrio parahaemolyticus TaxID=670 RepID=UPI001123A2F4|nr:hypothetical protein [Vibrio parahaemolyticus]EJG0767667.1 hypothetical protein [Vibrio parahaemolyticus O5:K30]ELA9213862.1 hypothetical protein [Vibrio parahaemolyticus]MBM4950893.1 hypothetical protein [Vibrio parahaemolyticus]MBM5064322.1 hypothetical protein [Vibrio parahaemolyticus]TOA69501.1 hypothetical protein CGK21_15565 [Vibrio parahaemolyticus]